MTVHFGLIFVVFMLCLVACVLALYESPSWACVCLAIAVLLLAMKMPVS